MANSQTNLKTPEAPAVDERTPWQKTEYERRRVSYRKEFKNLCLKHIQFLKRKESIIDFDRLLHVWQLYVKYKKRENIALLKSIGEQIGKVPEAQQKKLHTILTALANPSVAKDEFATGMQALIEYVDFMRKNINVSIDLLVQQIVELQQDVQHIKSKYAFIQDCLAKFVAESPLQVELQAKDFVNVVQEDNPQVQADKSITSDLADSLRQNLLNIAHKFELEIELAHSKLQELDCAAQEERLIASKQHILLQRDEYENFYLFVDSKKNAVVVATDSSALQTIQAEIKEYMQTMQKHDADFADKYANNEINLEFASNDFTHGMLQLELLALEEQNDLNIFERRAFRQQEVFFRKNFKRSQAQDEDAKDELARKLTNFRDNKEERQTKVKADFTLLRQEIENNINSNKTITEIEELKVKHKEKYSEDKQKPVAFAQNTILPVPPTPAESKFNLAAARTEVVIAIAQTVCESLARLAIAASGRPKPKTPQEQAGVQFVEPAVEESLAKLRANEDKATAELGKTRTEIRKLGDEINQLIKGLE